MFLESSEKKRENAKNACYIAETPLYEIGTKDMTYFAYDEKEKIDILDKIHQMGVAIMVLTKKTDKY